MRYKIDNIILCNVSGVGAGLYDKGQEAMRIDV